VFSLSSERRPARRPLRAWLAQLDPTEYVTRVFPAAKLRYAVMTNIPFAAEEACHWGMSSFGRPGGVRRRYRGYRIAPRPVSRFWRMQRAVPVKQTGAGTGPARRLGAEIDDEGRRSTRED